MIGINALSVSIYVTKVVQDIIISHNYKSIVGVSNSSHLMYIEGMTKDDTRDRVNHMRSKQKKLELEYEVKVSFLYLIGSLYPCIVISRNPQTNNKRNGFLTSYLYECGFPCKYLKEMRSLNSTIYGVSF